MSEIAAFDVCGPLPAGVALLEASAGTGKTYALAALAARYVAAGVKLENLLMVTFTRMATGELRERVRQRLVDVDRGLARSLAGAAQEGEDEVVVALCRGSVDALTVRRGHVQAALRDFDAATIATTHGFCERMLKGLGMKAGIEGGAELVEDLSGLLEEVVDDLYVRRFHSHDRPPFDRSQALQIATAAVGNPAARIEPSGAPPDSVEAMRWRLADAARREVDKRKRRLRILSYDDLLARLHEALSDPDTGEDSCRRLREQFRVALVDEFQDTDPIQWDILRLAFAAGDTTLVLIGDPKQAIYAFRGADVFAYLEAAREASTTSTLDVNWRADQGLIDAYDALFGGANLGHRGIRYRTVRAAPANVAPRLVGAPTPAPVRVRIVQRKDGEVRLTQQGWVNKASGRAVIVGDVARDIAGLLASDACVIERAESPPEHSGPGAGERNRVRVHPGHVAVLVRTNRQAALVRDALVGAGVPAVINGAGSVFATPVAKEWLALLEALERPSSTTRVHAVALTCFMGWDATRVASASEDEWEAIHARLHRWAAVLRQRGVASLLETVTRSEALPGRLLQDVDGERRITDLRHIGQLLHVEATSDRLGVTALTAWLRDRVRGTRDDSGTEERSRRLESDAAAVQVLTIHRSKGLEFPIVYLPFPWEPDWIDENSPQMFHDPEFGDEWTIDVALQGPSFARHRFRALQEQRGEELRLLYVALTRARHQAVMWWASSFDSRESPLGRLLFARDDHGDVAVACEHPPEESEVAARFESLALEAPGCVRVERVAKAGWVHWSSPHGEPPQLDCARFGRGFDTQWRRTSYSAITSGAHEPAVASEVEEVVIDDESMIEAPHDGDAWRPAGAIHGAGSEAVVPFDSLPGGTAVGSFVHAVLENVDFAAIDIDAELASCIDAEVWRPVDIGSRSDLVAGLRAAIETPLGPSVGELRLRDLVRADRLDELAFELPLVGGDEPSGELTLELVASLLHEHLDTRDTMAGYAERLRDPGLGRVLRGYLTGSIDLVMRLATESGSTESGGTRFVLVDYKTNWLGVPGEPLTAWHYRQAALVDAMQRAHYPLQALLYSVALHRYLRWRQRGYDPERNLGGVQYLFLRGMVGPTAPRDGGDPYGVFSWRPPASLVVALSDLFDRGRAA